MPSRIDSDIYIDGLLQAKSMQLPAGTVTDLGVSGSAGIEASKLRHEHRSTYAQGSAVSATDATQVIHVVRGAVAEVVAFVAGAVDNAAGDATVTVDLLKNGVSILTAPITLDSGDANYEVVEGVIASDDLVAEDVLEIVIDATIGTGTLPKGVFVALSVHEDPV